ncbi:RNA polymerase II C-terminal domain phosphatase-like 3 [Dichanthelium oligosanthes]|uniref:protein-serine/threonine phosphatase n=1 Tax=Dichanthelium oligosanthes TaxID=888268 RepID=A0A1E5VGL2_9POAL|nr:RNA polymerase II C-terminal domain phosphatase-like 3 [Dichanthelium oligosanthes]
MRVTVTPKDEERLVGLMARERPRSAVVAAGGDLVTATAAGEGSDGDSSGSIEEITADDFRKDSSSAGGGGALGGGSAAAAPRSRSWTGPPAMGYMARSYGQAFHSFAWLQAVQKKPLVAHPAQEADEDEEVEHAVDASDGEKEEGEIEEGEAVEGSSSPARAQPETIDLDSDAPEKSESVVVEGSGGATPAAAAQEEEVDYDQRVGSILEELEMVSIEEAEKSFEGTCTRLHKCFENLKPLYPENGSPMQILEPLVQQAFIGMDTLTTVANSYNLPRREQNKTMLLKLLFHIKNRYSDMLTPDQRDELDSRVRQLVFEEKDNASDPSTSGGTKAVNVSAPSGQVSSGRLPFESGAANPFSGSSLPRLEIPAKRISPLLDLHADYDENSLPSPTRDNAPPFPVPKPIGFGASPMVPEKLSFPERAESARNSMYPSLNDPLKAVSSYQRKYGQKSVFPSDDLPSPTPSGDDGKSADKGGDIFGEVSSFPLPKKTALPSTSQMPASQHNAVSSSNISYAAGPPGYAKQAEQSAAGPNHALKATSKSRDPRLRFLNRDSFGTTDVNRRVNFSDPKDGNFGGAPIVNRKHKAVDEPQVDENTIKRFRNGAGDPRNMLVPTGNLNQLMTNIRAPPNSSGINTPFLQPPPSSAPQISAPPAVSLPSLLKDIAGNPQVLMNWIQMEQQKMSASEPQQVATNGAMSSGTISMGTAGMVLPPGIAPKTTEAAQVPFVRPQVPMQTPPLNPQNDAGILRMKPRDPRRILHNNIAQKTDAVGLEQVKYNGITQPDSQGAKDQTSSMASQPALLSSIARPFTMSTKHVDPVSNSQLAATALMAPTPQASGSTNMVDPRLAVGENGHNADAATNDAPATPLEAVQPVSPWGDVDHLLDGYDDQQKALIQKERARRITEQHKMFSARKLCLVLDLDHTLLNSAKFIEVDSKHEEILRKKEEQDRSMPERHLYRFHHMNMWTKLRPGIWNFLEKASKLFELHLYTMGNKLYATEMAKVLDPNGTLFAGRVISRGDDGDPFDGDERVPKSKDLDGVLGMESAVVIIDDSIRVWPHNRHNLIVVERYTYFPCSRRQFGLPGPSLLEIDRDERPEDGTLASSLAVIERIHCNFFSHPNLNEADVRSILAAEQQSILAGCRIVFSRVFPIGDTKPHLHPLWQTAEQFGAVCTNQIDDRVTHVVANSLGTDKVNWALSTGRFVVHPGWVEASALLYRRANEHDFEVKTPC